MGKAADPKTGGPRYAFDSPAGADSCLWESAIPEGTFSSGSAPSRVYSPAPCPSTTAFTLPVNSNSSPPAPIAARPFSSRTVFAAALSRGLKRLPATGHGQAGGFIHWDGCIDSPHGSDALSSTHEVPSGSQTLQGGSLRHRPLQLQYGGISPFCPNSLPTGRREGSVRSCPLSR